METTSIETEISGAWIAIITLHGGHDTVPVDAGVEGAGGLGCFTGFGVSETGSRGTFVVVRTRVSIVAIGDIIGVETKAAHADIAGAHISIIAIEGGVNACVVGAAVYGAGILVFALFGGSDALAFYAQVVRRTSISIVAVRVGAREKTCSFKAEI